VASHDSEQALRRGVIDLITPRDTHIENRAKRSSGRQEVE